MSTRAYLLLVVGALIALGIILREVRVGRLRAKYAMIWLAVGLLLLPVAVIPGALDALARLAGVAYPPALLLVFGLGFFAALSIHFSHELSRLEERTRILAEEIALLREATERTSASRDRTP
jgi:hypothetical protein